MRPVSPPDVPPSATSAAGAAKNAAGSKTRRRRSLRAMLIDVYAWLDNHGHVVRPTLLAFVALCVGGLVAPDLRLRAYAVEHSLVGSPVTENIKAHYDLDIVDENTTARLRDENMQQVRPVFNYDRECSDRAQARIIRAFSAARRHLQAAAEQATPTTPPHAPASAKSPLEAPLVAAQDDGEAPTLAASQQAARASFEAAWGSPLSDRTWQALLRDGLSSDSENMLGRMVAGAQADFIVATRSVLDVGREGGITLQRVAQTKNNGREELSLPLGDRRTDTLTGKDLLQIRDLSAAQEQVQRLAGPMVHVDGHPNAALATALGDLAANVLEANLTFNRVETEMRRQQAAQSVKPINVTIKKGEMIVRDGERLTARHLMILAAMNKGGQSSNGISMALGGMVLLLLLCALSDRLTSFLRQDVGTLAARDLLFLASLFVASLAMSRGWLFVSRALSDFFVSVPRETWLFCLPVAFAPMVTRLVMRAEIALMFCVLHSLTLGLLADGDRMLMIYALCGSVAATGAIQSITSRSDLLRAGMAAGLTQAVAALGIQLFENHVGYAAYLWPLPAAILAGLGAAVLALSLTPLIEWCFDYTTDLKLLELANLNHPALKELIVQAPGSYHHSIIVGALVEAAAENINANPLLARVMAYYHDLGKGCNPGYFVENQRSGQNPHDKLKPSMSAMIIRRHVTDGMELARQHGLGEQILAGIAQHHGNTLIRVFYHKACELAGEGQVVQEADYRYPGTKPQTREAALVMLGDSIEAASRAMAEPSAARLQGLTQRIINGKFTDGQLDECDLTLRDLHTIAKSFSRVLISIYHHRLEYPVEAQDTRQKANRGDSDPKPARPAEASDADTAPHAASHLKRLGL